MFCLYDVMKASIKRDQSKTCFNFAEREKARLKVKTSNEEDHHQHHWVLYCVAQRATEISVIVVICT